MFKKISITLFLALALTVSAAAETKIVGFVQTWLTAVDSSDGVVDNFGLVAPHARVKFVGTPEDNIKLVVMPELAGGKITLLDAFGDWTLDSEGIYTLRFGQFKFPFGLNRMYHPGQLDRSNYSMLNGSLFPGHAWDVGGELLYRRGNVKFDIAVIEGQGPNLTAGTVGNRGRQDVSGRLEIALMDKAVTVGASIYQGLSQKTPWAAILEENHTWGGGHLKAAFGPLGLQAEVINRDDLKFGVNAEPSYQVSEKLKLVGYYDRIEDQANDLLGKTRMGLALVYAVSPKLEFTLDTQGNSTGPEQKPVSNATVLQAQFNF